MLVLTWETERAARPDGCQQQQQLRGLHGQREDQGGQHRELLHSDISLQRLAGQQHEGSSILSRRGCDELSLSSIPICKLKSHHKPHVFLIEYIL